MAKNWIMKRWVVVLLGAGIFHAGMAQGATQIPLSFLPPGTQLSFCGEPMPITIEDVRERFEKEFLLITEDRAQVLLWMKRSRRYLLQIEAMLKEKNMPLDLQYVPIVESSLLPHAGSNKGAVGFWQFIESSGKNFDLVINSYIDERRNLAASTSAAIRYFSMLYEKFGSWSLAVAAYNMGEGALISYMYEQGVRDYYKLSLSLETQRFLFRIVCVKLIFSNPAAFGFALTDDEYYPPLEGDCIPVRTEKETPVRIIAEAAGTYFKVIKDLNPEIIGNNLPPGEYNLFIPKDSAQYFDFRFKTLTSNLHAGKKEQVYVVKKGDSLSAIAGKFKVPLSSVTAWNRLEKRRPIRPGDRLVVFQPELEAWGRTESAEN
ncbi:MAG: transglycosylase SLT domain-containing protein [Pseudomonadota bacterium]